MMKALRKRLDREESGFTLIELMVVVLIISILVAIAIPTFLGARRRAQDRQAQSNLRNALAAEKVHYTDAEAYTSTSTDLEAIEPNLNYTTEDARIGGVAVEEATANFVVLRSQSASGTEFCLMDIATAPAASPGIEGTYYANNNPGTDNCPAGGATAGWSQDANVGW